MIQISSPSRRSLSLSPAWLVILGFALITALGLAIHVGSVLRLGFPLGAFVVGAWLYWRSPLLYVGFAWWLCFLTPFVRRLIDLQAGWVNPSPVLLAPFLVMLLGGLTVARDLPKFARRGGLPMVLSLIGLVYGFLVGVVRLSPKTVLVPALNWMVPLLFGLHLLSQWREYPHYQQVIRRTFLGGVLVSGVYGVMQFLIAPEWDRFWITSSGELAFGTPEPLGIRVFSTMNSPGPFAVVMMAGLLLLASDRSVGRIPAAVGGVLSFLLSQVRAAWLGGVIGFVALIPSLKPKLQLRLLASLLAIALVILPLANVEPFADVIHTRLQTFTETQDDASYNDRLAGYQEILGAALTEIPGQGLGYVVDSTSLGANDSGILMCLFSLGWLGTLPFLGGVLLLLLQLFRAPVFDPFLGAARAICVGIFAQIALGSVLIALPGMVFWTFAGLAIAGQQYYSRGTDR